MLDKFIIDISDKKDNDRVGYFGNRKLGVIKFPFNEIPFFFTLNKGISNITYFNIKKIDKFGKLCETISMPTNSIIFSNNFLKIDKSVAIPSNLTLDSLFYLEFGDDTYKYVSQYFTAIDVTAPHGVFTCSDAGTDTIASTNTLLTLRKTITRTDTNFIASGDFSINIDWGDGSQVETVTGVINVGDSYDLILQHTYTDNGQYIITLSGAVSCVSIVDIAQIMVININITDYTTQQTSIEMIFSGNVFGKYNDGAVFQFISGNYNTRIFSANGNYTLLIYGDLSTISSFRADNSQIYGVLDLSYLQNINNELTLSSNLITDLILPNSLIFNINSTFDINNNANLQNTNICTISDCSVVNVYNCLSLTNFNLSFSGVMKQFYAYNSGIQVIDFTNVTELNANNAFLCYDMPNVTTIIFGNINISGRFYASGNTNLTSIQGTVTVNGRIHLYDNQSLTQIPSIQGSSEEILIYNTSLTVIDLSGIINGTDQYIYVYGNNNLTTFNPTSNSIANQILARYNPLLRFIDIDLYNCDAKNINMYDNSMTQQEVDEQLLNCDNSSYTNSTIILTGNNSAPSATGQTYITNLQNKGWTVTTN